MKRKWFTRCKPLVTFKKRKARLDLIRKHLKKKRKKKPPMFWSEILWTDEYKLISK